MKDKDKNFYKGNDGDLWLMDDEFPSVAFGVEIFIVQICPERHLDAACHKKFLGCLDWQAVSRAILWADLIFSTQYKSIDPSEIRFYHIQWGNN